MKNAQQYALLTITFFTFSGCATIFNGSRDAISIEASKEAEIRVNGQYIGTGMATTTIPKNGEVVITASQTGCATHSVRVTRQFDPVTLLGLFIDFGVISILIVDGVGTGAWSKADTKYYRLTPQC